MAKKPTIRTFQLKITLNQSKPPIWRRVIVPENITLSALHKVIQLAMGWEDAHLHEFMLGGQSYGKPDYEWDNEMMDEAKFRINQLLTKEKDKLLYVYDFGDDWLHTVLLEKIISDTPAPVRPLGLAGKRACPPEDCGGLYGYYEMLDVMQDKQHAEYDEIMEWLGEDFNPAEFELDEVNARLSILQPTGG